MKLIITESQKRKLQESEEEKISDSSFVSKEGENYVVRDVPFVGDMTFTPAIIQWEGVKENPFFTDEQFKSVFYYLNKKEEKRQTPNKNTQMLALLFQQHPDLLKAKYLKMPLGRFVKVLKTKFPEKMIQVKKRQMPAYKALVNPQGGEDYYISFRVDSLTPEKGLYIWEYNGKPEYIGIASSDLGLAGRINQEYGNITSYKCTVDGQSQTCRSNVSIRDKVNTGDISLYISPVDVETLKNNPEFIELMDSMGFAGTRKDKNVLEVLEKFIINQGDFKDSGWNRRT